MTTRSGGEIRRILPLVFVAAATACGPELTAPAGTDFSGTWFASGPAAGHSITDWIDAAGTSRRAKRKILLSLDLDPAKLPGNAPLWRSIKHTLSYYRFPLPALQITPSLDLVPWYR